jgi:hypothetical protein
MKSMQMTILLALVAVPTRASEVITHIDWITARQKAELLGGAVVTNGTSGAASLQIENSTGKPVSVPLWSLAKPGITESTYAISGKVKYSDVQGEAYIELLSYFDSGGPYFSRTLGRMAPTSGLSGSSDWRDFMLPFFVNDGSNKRPTKLDINIYFPGNGRIWLGPIDLVQYRVGEYPTVAGAWWSDQQAGLYGGIGGSLLGCMGAAIGVLTSLGRARATAMLLVRSLAAIGLTSLIVGAAALINSQPYAVWYPLILIGAITSLLLLTQFRTIQKRFETAELRRMQSQDS